MKDYNFFEPYQKKQSIDLNFKSPLFLTLLALAVILTFSAGLVYQNQAMAKKATHLRSELEAIQATEAYKTSAKMAEDLANLKVYDENAGLALERIEKTDIINTDFLANLSKVLPESVNIESINLSRTSASFVFYAPTQNTVAELLDALDNSGLFLHTSLSSIKAEYGNAGFKAEINTVVKAGEE